MSENLEIRKKEILDRLASGILEKELAEEKALREAEERRIAKELEQQAIFAELETLLPELCGLNWKAFPAFMVRVDEKLKELAAEYDELILQENALKTHFRDLRGRLTDKNQIIGLINAQKMPKVEYPAEIALLLDASFRDTEGNLPRIFSSCVLRFLDFRRRQIQGVAEIIGGI